MQVMKELWEEMGYENLALTSQNRRDQAARLEKILGNVAETISRRVGMRENQTREENLEIQGVPKKKYTFEMKPLLEVNALLLC